MLVLLKFILQHTHLIPQQEYSSVLALMLMIQNGNFVLLMFPSEMFQFILLLSTCRTELIQAVIRDCLNP